MGEIALLLQILNAANLASPTIVGIINTIRGGRAAGKTDEEITTESMKIALETKAITDADKGDQ